MDNISWNYNCYWLCQYIYKDGFFVLVEILSPFNIVNYIAVIATLAPGILALSLAEKLKSKQAQKETEENDR